MMNPISKNQRSKQLREEVDGLVQDILHNANRNDGLLESHGRIIESKILDIIKKSNTELIEALEGAIADIYAENANDYAMQLATTIKQFKGSL